MTRILLLAAAPACLVAAPRPSGPSAPRRSSSTKRATSSISAMPGRPRRRAIPRSSTALPRATSTRQWNERLPVAQADRADAARASVDFHGHQLAVDWITAGQSRALALARRPTVGSFTGGAHANHGSNALLWDRQPPREITVADLFGNPAELDRLLRASAYCDALDAERARSVAASRSAPAAVRRLPEARAR